MDQWIPSEEETFAQIGCLLLLSQQVEHGLSALLGTVYPTGAPSWEEITSLERKTLGNLAKTLKQRVDLHPKFEGLLEAFVEGLNIFVHRLSTQPGCDTHTELGCDEIWKFLENYQKLLQEIYLVVTSALLKGAKDAGMPETKYHDELRKTGFLQEIQKYDVRSQVPFRKRKP